LSAPNHRELILAAEKKSRSSFLDLPEELQDQVIEGLDAGDLTLKGASDLVSERGAGPLSYEAIRQYYMAVRRERSLYILRTEIARIVNEYADGDTRQLLKSSVNLALVTAIQGLADGTVKIKDLDVARMIGLGGGDVAADGGGEDAKGETGGEQEKLDVDEVRRTVYGK